MSFNASSYQDPFWAKSGNFVRGRDPLGVQNSSISVYATLLPGMTNLTLRLRYYGFYLWLLDEYLKLDPSDPFKQDVESHYTFIRRAELILAFVMGNLHPNEFSVIGSDFVTNHIDDVKSLGYYDIEHGADKKYQTEEERVYWDYRSGALGQYYAGSLIGLGLMEQRQGMFRRTDDRGAQLAEAYKKSVKEEQRTLLVKRIYEGKLYASDLELLEGFALNASVEGNEEGHFYFDMLLKPDGAKIKTQTGEFSQQRKESIQLFLEKMEQEDDVKSWYNIPVNLYLDNLSKTKTDVSEASFGWYYYQINEYTHYYLETIFWGLLMEMDGKDYLLQHFLSEISTRTSDYCGQQHTMSSAKSAQSWMETIELSTLHNIEELGAHVKGNDVFESIAKSICGLLALYKENSSKLEDLKYYAYNHQVHDKRGNSIEIFQNYIEANLHLPLDQFIRNLVHTLMNEHISIAYYKMGNGEKNLLKFLIEDNYLVHIETMSPNFTNPRLRTLFNFMVDLRVISRDGTILERGKELLEELKTDEA